MFKMWSQDFDWSWHLIRPIAEAIYGGGEFNEIYRAAKRMSLGDKESWYREWLHLAEEIDGLGGQAPLGDTFVAKPLTERPFRTVAERTREMPAQTRAVPQ